MTDTTACRAVRLAAPLLVATGAVTVAGCESAFQRIDRRTNNLLAETNANLGEDTQDPRLSWSTGDKPEQLRGAYMYEHEPPTANPSAKQLTFTADGDTESVNSRLEQYARAPEDPVELDLKATLLYAVQNSREYRFAEEDYVLAALQLLSERHLWGPRLFNTTSAEFISRGVNGFHETSLRVVNDTTVTQRLPYGGEFTASLLAQVTQSLHSQVARDRNETLDFLMSLDIPLLRGAGMVAREDLIQSERNVIYAARRYERFRREFLVSITTEFLDLVIQQQAILNAVGNVDKLEKFEAREVALTEAGRQPPFQAALSAQSTLFARDRLNNQRELFRLSLDRFKVRIGMPESQRIRIIPSSPRLPTPEVELDQAVWSAMHYRLDLQNQRDSIDDSRRGVNNARNALLADLDLSASGVPTVLDAGGAPDIFFQDTTWSASVVLGLPIDRTIERLAVRDAQVDLERSLRGYEEFRDSVAVDVRAAVRNIDRAIFSRRLQEENVRIADLRLASIEAAPDRANARDRSDAAQDLLAAQDDYLLARRDEQVAILNYLLDSGQLRVTDDGALMPLDGMIFPPDDPLSYGVAAPVDDDAMPELTDPVAEDLAEQAEEMLRDPAVEPDPEQNDENPRPQQPQPPLDDARK